MPLTTHCSWKGLWALQQKAGDKVGAAHPDPTPQTLQDQTLML